MLPTTSEREQVAARLQVVALRDEYLALEALMQDPDRALRQFPDLKSGAELVSRVDSAWTAWFDGSLALIRAEHDAGVTEESRSENSHD